MRGLDVYVYVVTELIQLIPAEKREGATLILDEFGPTTPLRSELCRVRLARGILRHFNCILAKRLRRLAA